MVSHMIVFRATMVLDHRSPPPVAAQTRTTTGPQPAAMTARQVERA